MIKTGIFNKAHLTTLKKAVDVYAHRHQVTAQNISNVETAGYRARELKFEDLLSSADKRLQGVMTHHAHLSLGQGDLLRVNPEVVETDSGFDNGVNNVDIDEQMTELATNDLSYRLATRILSMRYSMLRGAVKGTMR